MSGLDRLELNNRMSEKFNLSEKKKRGCADGSKNTQFKKGYTPWNFKNGVKLKRKFKRFNGKLVLKSHYVFCKYFNFLEIPKGFVIHHIDGDSLNDQINNLQLMTDKNHKKLYNKKNIVGDTLNTTERGNDLI